MRVWVTRYADTLGIGEYDGIEDPEQPGTILTSCRFRKDMNPEVYHSYFHRGEWSTDRAEALIQAIKVCEKARFDYCVKEERMVDRLQDLSLELLRLEEASKAKGSA
jgi:hypothetical protein